jgi:phage terminase large subunit-like protein
MKPTRLEANQFHAEALAKAALEGPEAVEETNRQLCLSDLWFLLTHMLGRAEMNRDVNFDPDFLYARVKECQEDPDGYLDLWAREHYKSTIITLGKSVQDILNDPEITIGIFSVTREIAQAFLKQIKEELEMNTKLKELFPEVLYQKPESQSPMWGIMSGIRVKRKSNPKEETVEAWGLVSGMPTGRHFKLLVFDDVVTEKSVTNPDQLAFAFSKMRLALNLGSHGGKRRFIGTYYHFNDAWRQSVKVGIAKARIYPATVDGTVTGKSAFLKPAALEKKRTDMGSYIYSCQMLLDPKADEVQGFEKQWMRAWDVKPEFWEVMNIYIVVDPASGKKIKATGHDYTAMWVIGLAPDNRYYLIDGLRDRLNLVERTKKLFSLVRTYKPITVGYEEYGLQADIEHIEFVQGLNNYHFSISPLGGAMAKNDRIRKLIPIFQNSRFFTPAYLTKRDHEGSFIDVMSIFEDEEYLAFPVCVHDDMLDCMARILDPVLGAAFPDPDEYVEARGGYPNAEDAMANMSNGVDCDPLEAI